MKKIKLLFKLILMISIIVFIYNYLDEKINGSAVEVEVLHEIEEYGYSLNDNETEYYNSLFEDLKEELNKDEIDESNYAALVSKLFIADFYNLDNKLTNNDIGGVQFIEENYKDTFVKIAKDTIYKYVENNLDGKRDQDLPIVENVLVDEIKNDKFLYDGITSDSFEIDLTVEYKRDLGYQNDIKLILIKEDKKFVIVELN